VTDNRGRTRSRSLNVEVSDRNAPPLAKFDFKRITDFGLLKVAFDASASFKAGGSIVSYQWNFGDGKVGSGKNIIHEFATPGINFVELTVVDEFGAQASTLKNVSV